jgi:hypothetical protein
VTVDIEFQITTQEQSIVALVMGQAQVPRGMDIGLAHGAQLFYMGRELPDRGLGRVEVVYSFVLRVAHETAVDVGTNLLWDLITSADRAALITRVGILTREKTVEVVPRNPEGKRAIAIAIQALQRSPIPKSLWLGE